jgi:hypothetical protein
MHLHHWLHHWLHALNNHFDGLFMPLLSQASVPHEISRILPLPCVLKLE